MNTDNTASILLSPVSPRYFEGETYAEQVKELEAVGGDPSFLEPPTSTWDGTEDDTAHFGGWENEGTSLRAPNSNAFPAMTYSEQKKELEAVGGDPSFLDEGSPSMWDGAIDEAAHFGSWET